MLLKVLFIVGLVGQCHVAIAQDDHSPLIASGPTPNQQPVDQMAADPSELTEKQLDGLTDKNLLIGVVQKNSGQAANGRVESIRKLTSDEIKKLYNRKEVPLSDSMFLQCGIDDISCYKQALDAGGFKKKPNVLLVQDVEKNDTGELVYKTRVYNMISAMRVGGIQKTLPSDSEFQKIVKEGMTVSSFSQLFKSLRSKGIVAVNGGTPVTKSLKPKKSSAAPLAEVDKKSDQSQQNKRNMNESGMDLFRTLFDAFGPIFLLLLIASIIMRLLAKNSNLIPVLSKTFSLLSLLMLILLAMASLLFMFLLLFKLFPNLPEDLAEVRRKTDLLAEKIPPDPVDKVFPNYLNFIHAICGVVAGGCTLYLLRVVFAPWSGFLSVDFRHPSARMGPLITWIGCYAQSTVARVFMLALFAAPCFLIFHLLILPLLPEIITRHQFIAQTLSLFGLVNFIVLSSVVATVANDRLMYLRYKYAGETKKNWRKGWRTLESYIEGKGANGSDKSENRSLGWIANLSEVDPLIRENHGVPSPFGLVYGTWPFKPRIILGTSLLFNQNRLDPSTEAILAHEVAHVKRWDGILLGLIYVLSPLLRIKFFRRIFELKSQHAEFLSDFMAVALCPEQRRIEFAKVYCDTLSDVPLIGIESGRGGYFNRFSDLIDTHPSPATRVKFINDCLGLTEDSSSYKFSKVITIFLVILMISIMLSVAFVFSKNFH